MNKLDRHACEFGSFRLDLGERLLLRNGKAVRLRAKVFETLVVLVQNRGHAVAKDQLMKAVWAITALPKRKPYLGSIIFRGRTQRSPRAVDRSSE